MFNIYSAEKYIYTCICTLYKYGIPTLTNKLIVELWSMSALQHYMINGCTAALHNCWCSTALHISGQVT